MWGAERERESGAQVSTARSVINESIEIKLIRPPRGSVVLTGPDHCFRIKAHDTCGEP